MWRTRTLASRNAVSAAFLRAQRGFAQPPRRRECRAYRPDPERCPRGPTDLESWAITARPPPTRNSRLSLSRSPRVSRTLFGIATSPFDVILAAESKVFLTCQLQSKDTRGDGRE
jgi:hypothetical protein